MNGLLLQATTHCAHSRRVLADGSGTWTGYYILGAVKGRLYEFEPRARARGFDQWFNQFAELASAARRRQSVRIEEGSLA